MKLLTIKEAYYERTPFLFIEKNDFLNDNLNLRIARDIKQSENNSDVYEIKYNEQLTAGDYAPYVKTRKELNELALENMKNKEKVKNNSFTVIKDFSEEEEIIIYELEDFEDTVVPIMECFDTLRKILIEKTEEEKERQNPKN